MSLYPPSGTGANRPVGSDNVFHMIGNSTLSVEAVFDRIFNYTLPTSLADQNTIIGLGTTPSPFAVHADAISFDGFLPITGGTVSGQLLLTAALGANPDQAINQGDVDAKLTDYLPLTGGTLDSLTVTGASTLASATVNNLSGSPSGTRVPNLNYVSANYYPLTGGSLNGPLNTGSNAITTTGNVNAGSVVTNQLSAVTGNTLTLSSTVGVEVVADPQTPFGVATKQYVDGLATGLSIRSPVVAKTTGSLGAFVSPTNQYLESTINTALPNVFDGVSVQVGDRVLVDQEGVGTGAVNGLHAGLYDVTSLGSGASKWRLDRSEDADEDDEIEVGTFVYVQGGTVFAGSGWVVQSSPGAGSTRDIGTDPIYWVQFSAAVNTTAANIGGGAGVFSTKVGSELRFRSIVGTGGATVSVNGDTIEVDVDGTIVDHGLLTGLGDDDHPQYLLADGSRDVSGAMLLNYTVDPGLSDDNTAVNKKYVDDQIDAIPAATFTGGTLSSTLNLDNNSLINIGTPGLSFPTTGGAPAAGKILRTGTSPGQLELKDVNMVNAPITTNITIIPNREYHVNATSRVVTLNAGTEEGQRIEIVSDLGAITPNLVISTSGCTVNGATSYTFNTARGRLILTYDNSATDWVATLSQPNASLPLLGGTISGSLTVTGTPSINNHVVRLVDLNTQISGLSSVYVPSSGGVFASPIHANYNVGSATPFGGQTTGTLVTNKNYVDSEITAAENALLPLDGTRNMSADLNMGADAGDLHRIHFVQDPLNDQDAATKKYVTDQIQQVVDTGVVGDLDLGANAISNTGTVQLGSYTYPRFDGTDPSFAGHVLTSDGEGTLSLQPKGGTFFEMTTTGTITLGGGETVSIQTSAAVTVRLQSAGGTDYTLGTTNQIILATDSPNVTLQPLDGTVYLNGGEFSGPIQLTQPFGVYQLEVVRFNNIMGTPRGWNLTYRSRGYNHPVVTSTGQLDLQNKRLINLATPTADSDAATKQYVDSNVGAGGTGDSNYDFIITDSSPGTSDKIQRVLDEGYTNILISETLSNFQAISIRSDTNIMQRITVPSAATLTLSDIELQHAAFIGKHWRKLIFTGEGLVNLRTCSIESGTIWNTADQSSEVSFEDLRINCSLFRVDLNYLSPEQSDRYNTNFSFINCLMYGFDIFSPRTLSLVKMVGCNLVSPSFKLLRYVIISGCNIFNGTYGFANGNTFDDFLPQNIEIINGSRYITITGCTETRDRESGLTENDVTETLIFSGAVHKVTVCANTFDQVTYANGAVLTDVSIVGNYFTNVTVAGTRSLVRTKILNAGDEIDFDMNDGRIINLADPQFSKDAATKSYVDNILNFDSDLDLNNNRIINLADPQFSKDATTKSYVDNILNFDSDLDLNNNRIVNLTDPQSDQDAATKSYVDNLPFGLIVSDLDLNNNRIINLTDPQSDQDAATKSYVDNIFNPTLDMNDNRIVNLANPQFSKDAATKSYVDNIFNSDLDMNNNRIVNLADPQFSKDAATKEYVDSNINHGPDYFVVSDSSPETIFKIQRAIDDLHLNILITEDLSYGQVIEVRNSLFAVTDTSQKITIPSGVTLEIDNIYFLANASVGTDRTIIFDGEGTVVLGQIGVGINRGADSSTLEVIFKNLRINCENLRSTGGRSVNHKWFTFINCTMSDFNEETPQFLRHARLIGCMLISPRLRIDYKVIISHCIIFNRNPVSYAFEIIDADLITIVGCHETRDIPVTEPINDVTSTLLFSGTVNNCSISGNTFDRIGYSDGVILTEVAMAGNHFERAIVFGERTINNCTFINTSEDDDVIISKGHVDNLTVGIFDSDLDVNNNRIINLADPQASQDAVTLSYADTRYSIQYNDIATVGDQPTDQFETIAAAFDAGFREIIITSWITESWISLLPQNTAAVIRITRSNRLHLTDFTVTDKNRIYFIGVGDRSEIKIDNYSNDTSSRSVRTWIFLSNLFIKPSNLTNQNMGYSFGPKPSLYIDNCVFEGLDGVHTTTINDARLTNITQWSDSALIIDGMCELINCDIYIQDDWYTFVGFTKFIEILNPVDVVISNCRMYLSTGNNTVPSTLQSFASDNDFIRITLDKDITSDVIPELSGNTRGMVIENSQLFHVTIPDVGIGNGNALPRLEMRNNQIGIFATRRQVISGEITGNTFEDAEFGSFNTVKFEHNKIARLTSLTARENSVIRDNDITYDETVTSSNIITLANAHNSVVTNNSVVFKQTASPTPVRPSFRYLLSVDPSSSSLVLTGNRFTSVVFQGTDVGTNVRMAICNNVIDTSLTFDELYIIRNSTFMANTMDTCSFPDRWRNMSIIGNVFTSSFTATSSSFPNTSNVSILGNINLGSEYDVNNTGLIVNSQSGETRLNVGFDE